MVGETVGRWLPDFRIWDESGKMYYVEVKPIRGAPPKDLCAFLDSQSIPVANLLVLGLKPRKDNLGFNPRTGKEEFKLMNARRIWEISATRLR